MIGGATALLLLVACLAPGIFAVGAVISDFEMLWRDGLSLAATNRKYLLTLLTLQTKLREMAALLRPEPTSLGEASVPGIAGGWDWVCASSCIFAGKTLL